MYETVTYEDTINDKNTKLYIDVRSQSEYGISTIPGAINLPVLLDCERQLVGTLYDSGKIDEAKLAGIEAISRRLPEIFKKVLELKKVYKNLYFFCSRGGYRSSSIVNLLCGVDVKCFKISGGYKSYRKYITDNIDEAISKVSFITLFGYTGTGKTSILKHLDEFGFNVLDLEALANHRGSLLGSIGLDRARSQKMFDSLLFDELVKFENQVVFTEGESKKIGNVNLPNFLYDKIHSGKKILIDADINFRIEEIKQQYIYGIDKNLIIDGLNKLERYISKKKILKYIDEIKCDNFDNVVKDLCINYYDKNYKIPIKSFDNVYLNTSNICTSRLIEKDFSYLIK